MSFSASARVGMVETLAGDTAASPAVTHCRCGRTWNVLMERGKPGDAGCLRCLCNAELISWSGNVVFSACPADLD